MKNVITSDEDTMRMLEAIAREDGVTVEEAARRIIERAHAVRGHGQDPVS